MQSKKVISIVCSVVLSVVGTCHADVYGRNNNGNWHDTNTTWTIGGYSVSTLPGSGDTATLMSVNGATINLYESPVMVSGIIIGSWEAALTKTVTLNVWANLSTTAAVTIGANANAGNGTMIIASNASVSVGGSATIGTNAYGKLTINDGGSFTNAWLLTIGEKGTVEINDGLLWMRNNLSMIDGATINICGDSELWINNDQTGLGSNLSQYIASGWITGNGVAGNLKVVYDGTKTIVTAIPEPGTVSLLIISGLCVFVKRNFFS